ncbi:hypothetical protein [Chryseobacterium sp.]|uniref:hypothetical protein n=1 Tax=Chryseobacterium sp. TaxID=1871047 RepID=UPI0028A01351|nr:hypothetical protein [Chryseobacterium sp.]
MTILMEMELLTVLIWTMTMMEFSIVLNEDIPKPQVLTIFSNLMDPLLKLTANKYV